MSNGSPKISFSPTPVVAEVSNDAYEPAEPQVAQPTQQPEIEPAEAAVAPRKRVEIKPAPQPPEASVKEASVKADPVATPFAPKGLMAAPPPEPGFFQRNAMAIAVSLIVVLTFMLGVTTALLWSGNIQQANAPDDVTPTFSMASQDSQPMAVLAQDPIIAATESEVVTRTAVADFTDIAPVETAPENITEVVAPMEQPEPAPVEEAPAPLTLAQKIANAQSILNANKLRMLQEGVLAGLYTIETKEIDGVKRVRLDTINTDLSDDGVGRLLLQAASEGQIELPRSFRNSEGGVDLDTMMFSLVQNSLARNGTEDGVKAARDMSRKIFAASTVRTEDVGGKRIYTVQRGDSLAFIALQFYGKPGAFKRILDANRDTLQSPDKIQVGQRLIIPS
ncbi:LysM peptidoglycan-binding domain-containing protein [uncultured Sulfitobacter sp.]|uniref:LysM peptidoglycan-binding domain-containing protein n=1 Tax=uncultured Sulfitobacter sp. TaxID=191468 RepID=UPI00263642DC|nr:LysM peptidoglycan-binding domain-containing protein [uncultured Sulfitobacter sp.]